MSNFALPVTRDEFIYHDQLYVDVGNLNRHPRATIAELKSLLRPKIAKGKKKDTEAPKKDQVGHWYEAQCRHYGFPPTKDKNAAKVRLLDALNAGTLEIPARIKSVEADLKKQYAAANRKAKAAAAKAAKGSETVKDAAPSSSKKRKAADGPDASNSSAPAPTKKAKPSKSAVDETPRLSQKAMKERAEKASKASSSNAPTAEEVAKAMLELQKKERAEKKKAAPKAKAKTSANNDTTPKAKKSTPARKTKAAGEIGTTSPAAKPRTNQTARRGDLSSVRARPVSTQDRRDPIPAGMARRSRPWNGPTGRIPNTIKSEPDDGNDGMSEQDEHDYGYGTETSVEPDYMDVDQAMREVTGVYNITCPTVQAEWGSIPYMNTSQLRLFICSDGSQTWGSYSWGPFTGTILMDPGPRPGKTGVHFEWRNRERETGTVRLSGEVGGEIEFDIDAHDVQGAFFTLYGERMEFWGHRRPGPLWAGKPADQFKRDWDDLLADSEGRGPYGRGWR